MQLIEQISAKESILNSMASDLAKSGIPLILYGSGKAANKIYLKLIEAGISILRIAIDKKYLTNPSIKFHGREIEAFEDILDEYATVNVFVGIADNNLAVEKRLSLISKINRVIKYDYCTLYPGYDFSFEYVWNNREAFDKTYQLLTDTLSKDTMAAYLNQRISGDFKYLKRYKVDKQYFLNDLIILHDNEIFIDCGAYDGDSIIAFMQALIEANPKNTSGKIIALEPDKESFNKLKLLELQYPQLICIQKGAWFTKDTLKFAGNGYADSYISDNGACMIEVDSIDNILNGEPTTFIKMDIEGSELAGLKGATSTIQKYKPKLAICVYHKLKDLITIPQYIKSIRSDYIFYLRAHSYDSEEVVLYAV